MAHRFAALFTHTTGLFKTFQRLRRATHRHIIIQTNNNFPGLQLRREWCVCERTSLMNGFHVFYSRSQAGALALNPTPPGDQLANIHVHSLNPITTARSDRRSETDSSRRHTRLADLDGNEIRHARQAGNDGKPLWIIYTDTTLTADHNYTLSIHLMNIWFNT